MKSSWILKSFHHLSSLSRMCTLLSSKECPFSLRCRCTAESWPEELKCINMKRLLSYAVPCAYGAVSWSLLYLLYITALHTQRHSVFVWVSFGGTSLCLRGFLGLKCTGISLLEKILLSFSETHATHGITVCLRLFVLASLPVWFGPFVFANLTKAHFGYPQFLRSFLGVLMVL